MRQGHTVTVTVTVKQLAAALQHYTFKYIHTYTAVFIMLSTRSANTEVRPFAYTRIQVLNTQRLHSPYAQHTERNDIKLRSVALYYTYVIYVYLNHSALLI